MLRAQFGLLPLQFGNPLLQAVQQRDHLRRIQWLDVRLFAHKP